MLSASVDAAERVESRGAGESAQGRIWWRDWKKERKEEVPRVLGVCACVYARVLAEACPRWSLEGMGMREDKTEGRRELVARVKWTQS
jgi:hypothetical protein